MTEYGQLLKEVGEADASRAQDASNWCRDFLASLPFDEASRLEAVIRENSATYLRVFERETSLCKNAIQLSVENSFAAAAYPAADDSSTLGNAASLLSQLLIACERQEVSSGLLEVIETAYENLQRTFLGTVIDQVDELCSFLIEVSRTLGKLPIGDSKIFLLDLPVGNTIPVLLLRDLLEPSYNVEIIRISLSRNETKKAGVTRRDLLRERIAGANIRDNDIVIYLDEWETGSNFRAISEHLRKDLPPKAFFLPLALLSAEAVKHERYGSHCDNHDKMVRATWNGTFQRHRILMPRMRTCVPIQTYFFWADADRLAGLRKMQLHGSFFSTFDQTIEALNSSVEKLAFAIMFTIAEAAESGEPPCDYRTSVHTLQAMFMDGYKDYVACRDALRECADSLDRGGEIDDFSNEIRVVSEFQTKVLKDRPAEMAFMMAHSYLKYLGSTDPADRYFFTAHAPILVELTGRMALPHQVTMQFLRRRLMELSQSVSSGPV